MVIDTIWRQTRIGVGLEKFQLQVECCMTHNKMALKVLCNLISTVISARPAVRLDYLPD